MPAPCSSPLPALAQTPTPTPDPVAAADIEEQITVSSRAAESATASTEVLDRDRIERSQAHDAAELVRSVAGVHLLGAGGLAGTSHALTRGGDANFTLVLLDGIPLNDATDVQGGAFDLSTLDVDAIDSVEVLRGPHSHFFGSSAVAGAINLVTRDGDDGAWIAPRRRRRGLAGARRRVDRGIDRGGRRSTRRRR